MVEQSAVQNSAFEIRPAVQEDAGAIAELFLISSDGIAGYIWSAMAQPGQALEEVGRARYARSGVPFSYENCLIAERGGEVLGMLHAFEMPPREPDEVEEDPVLQPYSELEDPGSLYVSGLAVHAPYRSQGVGAALMDAAEDSETARRLGRMSLICFDGNERAMAFYRWRNYRELARRPIVPHPSLHFSEGNAVLLGLTL